MAAVAGLASRRSGYALFHGLAMDTESVLKRSGFWRPRLAKQMAYSAVYPLRRPMGKGGYADVTGSTGKFSMDGLSVQDFIHVTARETFFTMACIAVDLQVRICHDRQIKYECCGD